MFKKKNYLTILTIFNYFSKKNTNIFTNECFNKNIITFQNFFFDKTSFKYLIEFNNSFYVDIISVDLKKKINTYNFLYNYDFDFYLNYLNNEKQKTSNFLKNYNTIWLERENSEFFGIKYKNSKDCRNLLLNYNDNNNYLLKNKNIQNDWELKTTWHKRKIFKIKNTNTEL